MVRAQTRLVELRPHGGILELELIACVILREDSARTANETGLVRKVPRYSREWRRTVVVQREDGRGKHRIHDIAAVKRFSFNHDVERDDVHGDRHIAVLRPSNYSDRRQPCYSHR